MFLIVSYARSCMTGALPVSECGPLWQFSAIVGLLLACVTALLVMRLRAATASGH